MNQNGNGNGNGPELAPPTNPRDHLFLLYQQESYLRKTLAMIHARIQIVEQEKSELYAAMSAPQKSDEDIRTDLKDSLEALGALAGISEEG